MFTVLSSCRHGTVIARVHPVHLWNSARWPPAFVHILRVIVFNL